MEPWGDEFSQSTLIGEGELCSFVLARRRVPSIGGVGGSSGKGGVAFNGEADRLPLGTKGELNGDDAETRCRGVVSNVGVDCFAIGDLDSPFFGLGVCLIGDSIDMLLQLGFSAY